MIAHDKSTIASGSLAGRGLGEVCAVEREALLGPRGSALTPEGGFPLTVKLIDSTEGPLSVQVHPDKTEAWVALGADPEASILAGLDPDALDLERARSLTIAEITEGLKRHALPPYEAILLPSGTVHGLGQGIRIWEVAHGRDVTYRLHDWGRPRPLHVTEARSAMRPKLRPEPGEGITFREEGWEHHLLAAAEPFLVERIAATGAWRGDTGGNSFHLLTCITGSGVLSSGRFEPEDHPDPIEGRHMEVREGETALVPAAAGIYRVEARGANAWIRCFVPDLAADVIKPARAGGYDDRAIAALGGPSETNPLLCLLEASG